MRRTKFKKEIQPYRSSIKIGYEVIAGAQREMTI